MAIDVVVSVAVDVGVVSDGDVAVGAAKIPERTSGGWYKARCRPREASAR